jgi:alanine racemase
LKRDSLLANLPLGYSDGYRRAFSNKAYVLIRGHKVPVVGRTSMNTSMVDVTDFPDIRANDEVVLFGEQRGATVKQSDLEEYNGALLADVYTMWGNSNPKVVVR